MLSRISVFKIIAKIIIVTVVACVTLWSLGLYEFYHRIPVKPTADERKTDAIIVLTGGKDRVAEGIRLLNQKYAGKIFISGVGKSTNIIELLESQGLSEKEIKKLDPAKFAIGREAINTIGNAREAESWIAQNNIKSIRLVTSSYHMPRALLEFKKRMPGLKIIPHPVIPANFHRDDWRNDELSRRFILAEYTKYLMAKIGR
jgi:uncharacterized SAM-binding protein YcdF (DUF218 family)